MRKPTKQTKKSSKVASRAPKGLKPLSAARTVAPEVAGPTQIQFADPFPVIHKPDATADTTAMAPDEPQKAANF